MSESRNTSTISKAFPLNRQDAEDAKMNSLYSLAPLASWRFTSSSLQQMPHLLALGQQIPPIHLVRRNLNRHPFDNAQSIALDAHNLLRIVRQQPYLPHAEIEQDLG